ncbi:MAG TPA: hypothetical protein VM364_03435 [Vicinamibacterales bacterium]|nr:hypothetical protein [Vicinamibacterales bacterium]
MNPVLRRLGGVLAATALLALSAGAEAQRFELTVDAAPPLASVAQRVEGIRPESLALSLARAGLELPPRVHVTIIGNDDPRAAQMPPWVAGRAFGEERIVIFPQRIPASPYDSLDSLVLHEIVHLALNVRAGGRPLPRWFHEGVAVSVESGWGIGSQVRLLIAAAREPEIAELATLFESDRVPETTTAYLLAAALVEDVRRRHGLEIPGAIAGRVAAGEPFDRAFRSATGETVEQAATRAWRVYRGIRWLPVLTSGTAMWGAILLLAFLAFVVRLQRRRRKRREWDEEEEREEQDELDGDVDAAEDELDSGERR